nr:primase-helicase zinc-binding domain-containing protein [Aeromonas veronii]
MTLVSDVAAAACGRWPALLAEVGIDIPGRGKHGPCPACGGKDRFRMDDKEGRGTFICSQCGAGDGLDLVAKAIRLQLKEAAELIAPLVGLSGEGLDPAERERIHRQLQDKAEQERKRAEQQRKKAARRAADIMQDCQQGVSPYLEGKGLQGVQVNVSQHVIAVGEMTFSPGSLVVPLYADFGAQLVNVQLIDDQGSKSYLAGGQKAGACHRIPGSALVAICEGYATGLSIHKATGATVYCAMDAGNLLAVANMVRGADDPLQPCRAIICADNDAKTKGNPGKAKAEQAAAAIGALVAIPPEAGDWNDYHQAHGLDATKAAIMGDHPTQTTETPKEASQKEPGQVELAAAELTGAANEKMKKPIVPIEKMSASQRASLLIERLGDVAINIEAERVYRYDGSLWGPLADIELRREMAVIFTDHDVPFSDSAVSKAVATMKLMISPLGNTPDDLIGFANGVYDMATHQFRPHAAADGLLNHNGIEYGARKPGENIEQHAPSFTKWLTHAADSDIAKMERIKAALFMVLANRYDWQLFLEVTGEGGSGKSVFANIATLLAGGLRNTGSGNMIALDNARGRAQFVDKRLIVLPDQPKYIGDGSGIKAITGGDLVEVDGKYEKQFATVIRAVVLATNNEPMVITERNGGVARRRVIFTFDRVVSEEDKDPLLGDKIAAELPIVIRHLLERFAEPEQARRLLLEQRNSSDALTIKRATDPVIDLCSTLAFMDEPMGLFMGGNSSVKQEPKRYLYHLYLAYMEYHGLGRPLSVQKFSQAAKSAARELGREYRTRKIKGYTQTNAGLTEAAEVFMPQPLFVENQ